jgi:hypothetical protein
VNGHLPGCRGADGRQSSYSQPSAGIRAGARGRGRRWRWLDADGEQRRDLRRETKTKVLWFAFFFPTVFRFSFLGKGDNDRLAWRIHFRYANNRGERQKSNKCVSTESGAPPPLLRSTE